MSDDNPKTVAVIIAGIVVTTWTLFMLWLVFSQGATPARANPTAETGGTIWAQTADVTPLRCSERADRCCKRRGVEASGGLARTGN